MFSVYAVKLKNGHKNRFYIGTHESFEEAKHVCNCCTCGDADYSYAKDLKDGTTVFFLRRPDDYYDIRHTSPMRPPRLLSK